VSSGMITQPAAAGGISRARRDALPPPPWTGYAVASPRVQDIPSEDSCLSCHTGWGQRPRLQVPLLWQLLFERFDFFEEVVHST
jgi:hypothetical protein